MKKIIYISLIFLCLLNAGACSEKTSEELLLFDFESDKELDRLLWKCHTLFFLSNENATRGTNSLRIELYPSKHPAFYPKYIVNDWSRYKNLLFDVYNPEEKELSIIVRIDDKKKTRHSERFNKRVILKRGFNYIKIPLSSIISSGTQKPLNLKNIYKFLVFMLNPKEKHILFLDNVRLVK